MRSTYFIQSGGPSGPIKIGSSDDPHKRIAQLQCGNPEQLRMVAILEGDVERLYHDLLHEHRIAGEWFSRSIVTSLVRLARHERMHEPLMFRQLLTQLETSGLVRLVAPKSASVESIFNAFGELFGPAMEGEQ